MVFKELKAGYPLYILNRNGLVVKVGTVTNISNSHITKDGQKINNGQLATVVDVTVNVDGALQQFEVTESLNYTTSKDGGLLITPNKEDIANALRLFKQQSEEALKLVNAHKEVIKKCDKLIPEYDPNAQLRLENDERISKLEDSNKEMRKAIDENNKLLQELLSNIKR